MKRDDAEEAIKPALYLMLLFQKTFFFIAKHFGAFDTSEIAVMKLLLPLHVVNLFHCISLAARYEINYDPTHSPAR